jgi:hypothetical protein
VLLAGPVPAPPDSPTRVNDCAGDGPHMLGILSLSVADKATRRDILTGRGV